MEKYLADRYCDSRQWVFLTRVASSTGGGNRIADGMAFNMYASTGWEILGFEIKVSRSDFLAELKDMSKSNEIMEYCDKWYLVVSDASIVLEGELPKNWGLLVLKDGKLVQKVRAIPKKPCPVPVHFMASILRRNRDDMLNELSRCVKKEDIAKEIEEARIRGYEQGQGWEGKRATEDLRILREKVRLFEGASGLSLDNSWERKEAVEQMGLYVKHAMRLDQVVLTNQVEHLESTVKSLQNYMADLIKMKENLQTPNPSL